MSDIARTLFNVFIKLTSLRFVYQICYCDNYKTVSTALIIKSGWVINTNYSVKINYSI